MENDNHIYIAIDLKSFYASAECVDRGLNPLSTNLVVADPNKTEKTICLAVSPSLKAYGIPGRARLFEVVQKVKEVNSKRKWNAPGRELSEFSFDDYIIKNNPSVGIDYIVAPPRMAFYMEYSTRIYNIYLKYVSPEDIHVYSVDEVFIDITGYLNAYKMTAFSLTEKIVEDVYKTTGITATAGIGTNMYLCKIAMDIVAKHMEPNKDGARIAILDETSYRKELWDHKPITDFWRVGKGYAKKLESYGLFTMGDIARCSIGNEKDFYNEELLYKLFGVNAEFLIDHAWGYETCTIADIKAYKPETKSVSQGQVLEEPYDFEKTRLIVSEMADLLVLDLVEKGLYTNQIVLTVGYDIENIKDPKRLEKYKGPIVTDGYGRKIPKHAHGTINLDVYTSSTKLITDAAISLFDNIVDKNLLTRRVYIVACNVLNEDGAKQKNNFRQLNLFSDFSLTESENDIDDEKQKREKKMQEAVLDIKKKYGKNAIVRGMNLKEGATTMKRNRQIGGHKA